MQLTDNTRYAPKRHLRYRGIQLLALLLVLLVLLLLLELTQFAVSDFFLSSLAFLPTGWGILSICLVVKPLLEGTATWPVVVALARLYELAIAAIVLVPLALLSWLPGFQAMQSRILFNQAFSKGLLISRLLSGKKSQS
jgi:callose synthase